jgi:pterin-4a-carbinolamine dehydratase
MPKPTVFISYRRRDTWLEARTLADTLNAVFGGGTAFFDRDNVRIGDRWPDRIRSALEASALVLVLIGRKWLRSADQFGRRLLDVESDWVRTEIRCALASGKTVIPVVVGGARLPDAQALPEVLRPLLERQCHEVRDEWQTDVDALIDRITDLGFSRTGRRIVYPSPQVHVEPLSEEELESALENLPEWRIVEGRVAGKPRVTEKALTRVFVFETFEDAMHFMATATRFVSRHNHHPRWENIWKSVSVGLSTWDIGHRPSRLDLDLAYHLDALFEDYRPEAGRPPERAASRSPGYKTT